MSEPPPSPSWLELADEEYVLLRTTPSSNLVLAAVLLGLSVMMAMAVVVGFLTTPAVGRPVSFVVLIMIIGAIAGTFLLTKRREYVVTDRRALAAVGFLDREVSSCPLSEVRDLAVEQSTWQQLFDVGTLRFEAADDGVVFRSLENPTGVQSRLLGRVDLGEP